MVQNPAHSLRIWHKRKYGTASDPRPYRERTPGDLLLEHYLDLAVELSDLQALVEKPFDEDGEGASEKVLGKAQKRIRELQEVLLEGEPGSDPWLDEWDGENEDVDLEEFKNTIFKPESFL